ncbi:hypothetical protein PPACK8108_LOCUS26232 [Phakopsora pachyrhizi]|uniref:Uncharacterized protein n=1 Tax=Phakopsora pachyrhizi TaxID=170000 RepID=A0AAV0BTT9_PHAPC|nr:hypothetical protein PPACK8108_LOCUS26232 [Phakopsora pachyrhizi]
MHLPPANLGNAAHGKLQSADWIILFTTIIPFAIPLLENLDKTVIKNIFDLVIISEIILNYKTSEQAVENYYKHLVSYQVGLQKLRPDLSPTPNQHMAFHIPLQHANFGPSSSLACWQFEQFNGILQKTPNNGKLGNS